MLFDVKRGAFIELLIFYQLKEKIIIGVLCGRCHRLM